MPHCLPHANYIFIFNSSFKSYQKMSNKLYVKEIEIEKYRRPLRPNLLYNFV